MVLDRQVKEKKRRIKEYGHHGTWLARYSYEDFESIHRIQIAEHHRPSSEKTANGSRIESCAAEDIPGRVIAKHIDSLLSRGVSLREISQETGFGSQGSEIEGWTMKNGKLHNLPAKLAIEATQCLYEESTAPTADIYEHTYALANVYKQMKRRADSDLLLSGTPMSGTPYDMHVTQNGKYKDYLKKTRALLVKNYVRHPAKDSYLGTQWRKILDTYWIDDFASFRNDFAAAAFPCAASHVSFGLPHVNKKVPIQLAIGQSDMVNSALGGGVMEMMAMNNPYVWGINLGVRDARMLLRHSTLTTHDSHHIYTKEEYVSRIQKGVLSGAANTLGRTAYLVEEGDNPIPVMHGRVRLRLEKSPHKKYSNHARIEATGGSMCDPLSLLFRNAYFVVIQMAALHARAYGMHPTDYYQNLSSIDNWNAIGVTADFNKKIMSSRVRQTIADAVSLITYVDTLYGKNEDVRVLTHLALIGVHRLTSLSSAQNIKDLIKNPLSGTLSEVMDTMSERGVGHDEVVHELFDYQDKMIDILEEFAVTKEFLLR